MHFVLAYTAVWAKFHMKIDRCKGLKSIRLFFLIQSLAISYSTSEWAQHPPGPHCCFQIVTVRQKCEMRYPWEISQNIWLNMFGLLGHQAVAILYFFSIIRQIYLHLLNHTRIPPQRREKSQPDLFWRFPTTFLVKDCVIKNTYLR